MRLVPTPSDPFLEAMRPPPDETPGEKADRIQQEADAQRISDSIDEALRQERAKMKKEKQVIKVLLLGQAESGKSTTLKNFRMRYAREAWNRERNGWRVIVQLNVVRAILTLVAAVEAELNDEMPSYDEDADLAPTDRDGEDSHTSLTDHHRLLIVRLAPLRAVEIDLRHELGVGIEPTRASIQLSATPFEESYSGSKRPRGEYSVRSWDQVMERQDQRRPAKSKGTEIDPATLTIVQCKNDMQALWMDQDVRSMIKRRKLDLSDSAGFFLNDLDRIVSPDYIVSDDDIVRARLRTVGIQEHRLRLPNAPFAMERGFKLGYWEWRIFDVGGCRTLRTAWLPFFENVNVIIFLSPVSVFDQRLEEDSRINRLEDSIVLWTSICSSKLLGRTQLILFLNKCDLLRRKLRAGVQFNKYLPSYGDRANEVIPVVKYLREKFRDIQKVKSPDFRSSYIYPTTATDTKATATTLESVRDGVLRENLARSKII